MARQISPQILQFYRDLAARRDLDESELLRGLDRGTIAESGVSWETFAELNQRLERQLGGSEGLRRAGASLHDNEGFQLFRNLLRSAVSVPAVLRLSHRWIGPRMFPGVTTSIDRVGTALHLRIALPPDAPDNPGLFHILHGFYETLPQVIGRDPVEIEARIGPGQALYIVHGARSAGIWTTLRDALLSLFRSRGVEEEVGPLVEQYWALNQRLVQAEVALVEAEDSREATRRALALKSEFTASVSHELRTPLHTLMMSLELLDRSALSPEQRGRVHQARVSAGQLHAQVEDLLDFSRFQSGTVRIDPAPTSLVRLADHLGTVMGERARERRLWATIQVDAGIPPIVQTDPGRLRQIVTNLVDNALKFTREGGVDVRILEDRPGWIRLTVADTGEPIPRDMREELFQPFTQAEGSIRRSHGGLGLGLAITERATVSLGGTIRITDSQTHGNTFEVRIPAPASDGSRSEALSATLFIGARTASIPEPLQEWLIQRTVSLLVAPEPDALLTHLERGPRPTGVLTTGRGLQLVRKAGFEGPVLVLDELATEDSQARLLRTDGSAHADLDWLLEPSEGAGRDRVRSATWTGRPVSVLVTDDQPVNRAVLTALLKKLGVRDIGLAADGSDAVRMAQEAMYDLVFMDLHMPGMDGMEAARLIREKLGRASPPIVGLTADARPWTRQAMLDTGFVEVLAKPVDGAALLAALHRHVSVGSLPPMRLPPEAS